MRSVNPPLGWNSWDCYGAAVDEDTVKRNARFMAEHLKRYGWEYIVVDIQWYEPSAVSHDYKPFAPLCMDEYSRLIPAENKFPSSSDGRGFAPLADYVHSLGLKFGIHIMRGIPRQAVHSDSKILGTDRTARDISKTASICAWNTDMYGVDPSKEGAREYYDSLFDLYASWGVDFIKCDDICRELPHEETELIMLSESLRSCGRDMLLSLSPGPALLKSAEVYKLVCDMWRITDDFWDDWQLLYAMFERAEKWSVHAGAGHWPDADMLPVGAVRQVYGPENRTRFTADEQYTMMTLWSILRSPLMIGGDLPLSDKFTIDLLTNEAIIDMNRSARHSHQVWRRVIEGNELILWTAQCSHGGQYAAIFNAGDIHADIDIPLTDLEIYGGIRGVELWSHDRFTAGQHLSASVPPHGVKIYLLNPQ